MDARFLIVAVELMPTIKTESRTCTAIPKNDEEPFNWKARRAGIALFAATFSAEHEALSRSSGFEDLAMDCRRSVLRRIRVLVPGLVLAAWFGDAAAMAQESQVSLESLLQRIERLETDNQQLRARVEGTDRRSAETAEGSEETEPDEFDSETVSSPTASLRRVSKGFMYDSTDPGVLFNGREPAPLLSESQVRNIVAQEIAQRDRGMSIATAFEDPALDALQDQRIASLDNAFKAFQDKANKKTYPTVTPGGVFQVDSGWVHQDTNSEKEYGQIQDGSDFRRARLGAKGSVTELTNYFFQMDFGFFGRPTFTDVWVEQTKVPFFGNIKIGQWKQPFSLEVVSSFRYTTFMERSLLFQAFTPFRHVGIGFYDHSDDLSTTWAASGFRTGQDQFGATLTSDGGYGTAERLTWVPSWENDGKSYLHLGAGHFLNAPPRDTINFRTIPEFFVGANASGAIGSSGQPVPGGHDGVPFFVATGNIHVPIYNVLGSELLWVEGPVSLQSEAMVNFVNQGGGSTAVLPGAYAQLGYFLTGEHRPYDRKTGTIDRVIPKSNVTFNGTCCDPGLGAWEVASRVSYLDLNDGAIRGGRLLDCTVGLNWYWNPYTKMVFNWVHATSDNPTFPKCQTDLFGVRAQLDF